MKNFVDIQVNGYAGISFQAEPLTEPQIQFVAQRLRAREVRAVLPTIVTDDLDRMAMRLRSMRALIDQDDELRQLMPAFHIEGPCLSPVEGFRGAHDPNYIVPATRDVIEPLIDAAGGIRNVAMVTLAPECDAHFNTTLWLAEQGVIVCAGHTDAPLDCLREAERAGLSFFTHLGNGSAQMLDRHDNIIYRAMSVEKMRYSLIHDGHHLPFWLAAQWIRWLGIERCVFTTDCVEAADAPPDVKLPSWRELDTSGETPVTRLKGTPHFAGAAHSMMDGYRNAVKYMGFTETEATALSSTQPAKLIEKWMGA